MASGGAKDQAAKRSSRSVRRRRWFRVVAVLGSLSVSLLLGEAAVRLIIGSPLPERRPLMMVEAHPTRGWVMQPRTAADNDADAGGFDHYTYIHRVRLNELGLRGAPIGPKAAGEVRIVALGDSLVYGQGVAEADTLPAQIESHLNAAAATQADRRTYRVINAGVRGYSTAQELAMLRELGPTMKGDVVVLFWYWNDLKETEIRDDYLILKQLGPVPFDTLEPIEGWAAVRWYAKQTLRRSALVMYAHDVIQAARAPSPPAKMVDAGVERFRHHANDFLALAKRDGFTPMVALIPDANALYRDHESERHADRIEQVCNDAGLPVIRLIDPLRSLYGELHELPVVPFDGHYDGRANQVMGEAVAKRLRDDAPITQPTRAEGER